MYKVLETGDSKDLVCSLNSVSFPLQSEPIEEQIEIFQKFFFPIVNI